MDTNPPTPPLPLLAVRAELEQVTNIAPFDRWATLAREQAEQSGDLTQYHRELHGWLNTALSGKHQDHLLTVAFEHRDEALAQLVREWTNTHPALRSFA